MANNTIWETRFFLKLLFKKKIKGKDWTFLNKATEVGKCRASFLSVLISREMTRIPG